MEGQGSECFSARGAHTGAAVCCPSMDTCVEAGHEVVSSAHRPRVCGGSQNVPVADVRQATGRGTRVAVCCVRSHHVRNGLVRV